MAVVLGLPVLKYTGGVVREAEREEEQDELSELEEPAEERPPSLASSSTQSSRSEEAESADGWRFRPIENSSDVMYFRK